MDSKPDPLHILFFPHLAHGHMIPTIDMARVFARQGVKATILTTHLNASFFSKVIERDRELGFDIDIVMIKFPSMEADLPEGIENISSITSQEMGYRLFKVVRLLQQPLQQVLEDCHPNCLVADGMFPWATEVARKVGIPRLVFYGTSYLACCVLDSFLRYEPLKNVTSDDQLFEVPGIPDKIMMTGLQQAAELRDSRSNNETTVVLHKLLEAEITSSGVIMNSFQELEPAYVQHYRKTLGRKTWHIGPLSLCNNDIEDKLERGNANAVSTHRVECLRWLDTKKPNSVLYICFGSVSWISPTQLNELAKGIEASGVDFIWVSITAGVPMVTWPLSNEQFSNEKLVTDIVRVGVGVGAQECSKWMERQEIVGDKRKYNQRNISADVVGCTNLKNTEWISRQDPYVCLEYGSTQHRTSTCTDGGKMPIFQEKFTFSLIEGLREINVVVWNSNTVTYDDFIGIGKVQLQRVLSYGYDDNPWPLQTKTGRYAGEARLIMRYEKAQNPVIPFAPSAPPYATSPYQFPPYSTLPQSYPTPSPYPAYPSYPSSMYPPLSTYPPPSAYPPPPLPSAYPPASPYYPPVQLKFCSVLKQVQAFIRHRRTKTFSQGDIPTRRT
ncbi:hypothetical protein GOBAR_DD25015 [Gossypium barbadense]|nr:hypothetical protein GOBAR_DD25015 [Gossypium barbadense]